MEARVSQERPALHHKAALSDPESFLFVSIYVFECCFLGVCTCATPSGVEIRGQLAEVDSLLPHEFLGLNLDSFGLYPLSHLTGQQNLS